MKVKGMPGIAVAILFAFGSGLSAQSGTELTSSSFGQIQARHIGPALMSGRITCIDALQNNPLHMYVGTASGGVWKSTNGGVIMKPV